LLTKGQPKRNQGLLSGILGKKHIVKSLHLRNPEGACGPCQASRHVEASLAGRDFVALKMPY